VPVDGVRMPHCMKTVLPIGVPMPSGRLTDAKPVSFTIWVVTTMSGAGAMWNGTPKTDCAGHSAAGPSTRTATSNSFARPSSIASVGFGTIDWPFAPITGWKPPEAAPNRLPTAATTRPSQSGVSAGKHDDGE
jgi:hypothetical protein